MFDRIAERYDAANRVMSVGIDVALAEEGHRPRCSTGWARRRACSIWAPARWTARWRSCAARPGARVVAADFAREMLKVGRAQAGEPAQRHRDPRRRRPPPALRDGVFDGAFSGFCVRNLRDLPRALAELRRVVRPGGRVVILEFLPPREAAPVLRSLLQRPRPAADRLGGDRRPGRLPLPARLDRALPLRATSSRPLLREVGFADGRGEPICSRGRRLDGGGAMKLVVAVGGASGSIYAKRLLDVLVAAAPLERARWACASPRSGDEVWPHELGAVPDYPFRRYGLRRLPGAVRLGLGRLGRDGGDPLLDRRPGPHRPRHLRRSDRARRRRDAEGAAQAGAGGARDAAVARSTSRTCWP